MIKENFKKTNLDSFELNVNDKDSIIIQRQLLGKTKRDIEIENLPLPTNPFLIKYIIKMIRYYQLNISAKLGNRCVFDPSCSHYSEIAYREKGFLKGTILTIKRLYRCRPKNGGIDDIE